MGIFVQSFDHMSAVSSMIGESLGGLIFIYPVVFVLTIKLLLVSKDRHLRFGWHILGLILASILHVYSLIIIADIENDAAYLPFKAAANKAGLYYSMGALATLVAQFLLFRFASRKIELTSGLMPAHRDITTEDVQEAKSCVNEAECNNSTQERSSLEIHQEKKVSKIKQLCGWYSSRTSRQRNILRLVAFLLSAAPIVGWIFIAPWMVPLMLYLEYQLKPVEN